MTEQSPAPRTPQAAAEWILRTVPTQYREDAEAAIEDLRGAGRADGLMDPRDMHGLAIAEGNPPGHWFPYCPACSWAAGEQVGRCCEEFVAAQWPGAQAFVAAELT